MAGGRIPAGVRMLQKALQLRSRIAQGLNVPTAYVSASRSLRPCLVKGASRRAGVGRVRQ
jgi:hypothetical protein